MADRIHPSAKPPSNPSFPATKSQLYGASRPIYRPTPKPRRSRSLCCSCCLWISLVLLLLILAVAASGAVIWFLYRPHRPSFSVSSLRLSSLSLTTTRLNSRINLSLSAHNPNKKLTFFYDPSTVSVLSGTGVSLADGSFPAFLHGTKNTTALTTALSSSSRVLDSADADSVRSDLSQKKGFSLQIQLDTKVRVKMGALKTNRVKIRVSCDGITVSKVPKGNSSSLADSSASDCKVKFGIKIWKWHL